MELKIDQEKNIAYIKITGPAIPETILSAFDAIVSHPQYKKGMGRLWDFTEADLSSIESETIKRMGQYSLNYPHGINDVRVAFVAKGLEYGLARMLQMSSKAKTPINVFHTLVEAENWLLEQEETQALVA